MSAGPPLSSAELASIVDEVVSRLERESTAPIPSEAGQLGVFADLDEAVASAEASFQILQSQTLELRRHLVEAMRACVRREAATVARLAVEETGLGRVEDKIQKNLLVGEKTPGPEILDPWVVTGDHGMTLQELAPWGVISAIAPTTNPTETIICNGIGMISAGNAVVFGPHPAAKRVSAYMIAALNRAIVDAGGPPTLLCALAEPSIELAQKLMQHPGTRLVVVTGGPGVVQEAMRSGKRVIGAGPGNPPSVVDETADIDRAARDLVLGASLDNNIICTDEKEVFAVASITDRLKQGMETNGAVEIHGRQIEQLEALILASGDRSDPRAAHVQKDWVGQDAAKFLDAIGVKADPSTRLVIAEVDPDHPFVWTELLMPVLPIVRVRTAEEAMDLAVAAEKNNRHTASMHSHDIDRLSRMARRINCSIFTKNGPNYAGLGMGGEGYTSFTIAGPTGDGMTTARHFARWRRCTLVDSFRIV